MNPEVPIWEEPVRGFYTDPGQFLTRSGLDVLRSRLAGGLGPPIRYLFGLAPTAAEPGGVTFTMPLTDWLLFPQGVVSGATLGILVDAPLGCAVQTAMPPATPFTTAEISLKFLRTVGPQSGRLTAKGRLIHAGQSTGPEALTAPRRELARSAARRNSGKGRGRRYVNLSAAGPARSRRRHVVPAR
jgi:acyl-coenzyme A thioesterase PaaI-like protein